MTEFQGWILLAVIQLLGSAFLITTRNRVAAWILLFGAAAALLAATRTAL